MSWVPYVTMFLLMTVGLLLIFIILLQRGRGGGLAGALGGMGGQSAFGTKAGDVFTRITVVLAIIWVVLAAGNVYALRGFGGPKFKGGSSAIPTAPEMESKDGDKEPADTEPSFPPAPAQDEKKPDATTPAGGDAPKSDADKTEKAAPEKTETPAEPKAEGDAAKPAPEAPVKSDAPAEKSETSAEKPNE
jgi:preprotein translocase subunit SecG